MSAVDNKLTEATMQTMSADESVHLEINNLDNDYAPCILKKCRDYSEIWRFLKERQIPFQTLYPAKLKVTHNDGI